MRPYSSQMMPTAQNAPAVMAAMTIPKIIRSSSFEVGGEPPTWHSSIELLGRFLVAFNRATAVFPPVQL